MKEIAQKLKSYNKLNPSAVGLAVLIVYALLLIIVSIMHEPWYDEAQAWQIAREASYHDILFFLPHYESHPPLWHLVLSVPAKLGLPYEISIKTINIIFALLAVALIEFRSNFNNWTKTFLPFTFYVFYLFGVNSRPYSMMLLALLLCALFFDEKDSKPVRFLLSLAFLCLTSDYGIAIAGGITLAWIIDIFIAKKSGAVKDIIFGNIPRLIGFIGLALLAGLIALEVWPASDTTVMMDTPVWYKFYMIILVAPAEAFVTDCLSSMEYGAAVNGVLGVILTSVVSVILWTIGIVAAKRRKALHHFLLPVLMFALIGAFYSAPHHYGIYVMLFIYEFWILRRMEVKEDISGSKNVALNKIYKIVPLTVMAIACIMSLYWTLTASLNEAVYPFYYSRDLASWLTQNTTEDDVVMACWHAVYEKDENGNADKDKLAGVNFKSVAEIDVPTKPYFDYMIIDNELYPYQWLGKLPDDVRDSYIAKVQAMGSPDYIITYNTEYMPGFLAAIGSEDDYDLAMVFFNRRIFKDDTYPYNIMVFRKK